jgi:hypothetical protein
METYGWIGYVQQIVSVADRYPADTMIFTGNYGEAGALSILGPAEGLRNPVSSGHNAYGFWDSPPGSDVTVLCVGEFEPAYVSLPNYKVAAGTCEGQCRCPRTWSRTARGSSGELSPRHATYPSGRTRRYRAA